MSGFAPFASSQARFARSPSSSSAQPLRTSPLKESYVPRGTSTASSSRSSSPFVHADTDTAGYTDADASASSSSHSSTDFSDDEDDLVFFGTPTARDVDAIARLSSAIPGSPGTPYLASPMSTFTPSKRVKRVKKRDSREFLRRQTILHQPVIGDTPARSTGLKGKGKDTAASIVTVQGEEKGQKEVKIWPGGLFERLAAGATEEDVESDHAPTPLRIHGGTASSHRRVTLSPTRRHDDCELTFDFHRLGLSTPVAANTASPAQQHSFRRSTGSSSFSSVSTEASHAEREGAAEMEFSADEELADSDKENCPAPVDEPDVGDMSEDAEQMARVLFEGPLTGATLLEDASVEVHQLDMGGLKLEDYGDEDVGGAIESDDGGLSDSSDGSRRSQYAEAIASHTPAKDVLVTDEDKVESPVEPEDTETVDGTNHDQADLHHESSPSRSVSPRDTPAHAAPPSPSPSSSSFTDSPLPMSRAPAKIPIVPHFSPIRHDPPLHDDTCNDELLAPAYLVSPAVPALAQRVLATPEGSPFMSAASRPIRTLLPLSTPTPEHSASVKQSNAFSVASPGRLATSTNVRSVPASMQKARQAAKSRELSPGAKSQRSQNIKDQLASAIDASATASSRPPTAQGVASSHMTASTSSSSARGRLGMGPPARPGSASSNSSSSSTGTRPMPKPAAPSSRITCTAQSSTSASSRSAVSRLIPSVNRTGLAGSESTRTATGAKPVSSSSSSASSSSLRPQGSRSGITKPLSGTTVRSALASSTTKPAAVPRPALAPRDLSRVPSTSSSVKPVQSSFTSSKAPTAAVGLKWPIPLSVSTKLNAVPASSARSSPARLTGVKRARNAINALPQPILTAVGAEAMGSSRASGLGDRPERRILGPAKRLVGANVFTASVTSRAMPPPSPPAAMVAPKPDELDVPSHFSDTFTEPPHFQMGVAPVIVNTPRMGRAHRAMGSASRAGGSAKMTKMFHLGTPSKMTGLSTTNSLGFRPMGQASLKSAFEAVAAARSANDSASTRASGPHHFESVPEDSDASPAANTRSQPSPDKESRVPLSSPPAQARGSSEDHAEVSFMIPNAASSSEPGSSPIKRSGNKSTFPPTATSNDPPSSPPTTRSASQSPSKPVKAKRSIPGAPPSRAKSSSAKAVSSAGAAVKPPKSAVPSITEKELKTKTAFNTAKNEKRQCAIDRKVIHIDLPRPPSPTSKIPTTAAREEREKKMGREERARRRKQDEEDAKADSAEMLVQREERAMGPGDEEAWVYADAEEDEEGDTDLSGHERKRVKTTHVHTKKVKWDKGVVVIRDFGEGLGKLVSSTSESSTGSRRERPKSALSMARQVTLDEYGNIVPTPSKKSFSVKPQKVVVQAIFYQGEEPYVAPAVTTKGKKKAAT